MTLSPVEKPRNLEITVSKCYIAGRTVLTGAGPPAVRDGRQGPDGTDAVRGRYRQVPAVERTRSRCYARAALAVALSAHPH